MPSRQQSEQAQHVAQGLLVRRIGEHPASAHGGAAGGIVDGNNGFQSGFRIAEKGQVFVVVEFRMAEYVHGGGTIEHFEILSHLAGSRHERVSCFCRPACGRRFDFIGPGFPLGNALLGLDRNKLATIDVYVNFKLVNDWPFS